jgi:hypothetical protein
LRKVNHNFDRGLFEITLTEFIRIFFAIIFFLSLTTVKFFRIVAVSDFFIVSDLNVYFFLLYFSIKNFFREIFVFEIYLFFVYLKRQTFLKPSAGYFTICQWTIFQWSHLCNFVGKYFGNIVGEEIDNLRISVGQGPPKKFQKITADRKTPRFFVEKLSVNRKTCSFFLLS